jgi:hypothetical protein
MEAAAKKERANITIVKEVSGFARNLNCTNGNI